MPPSKFTASRAWWLYDATDGRVILKHPYYPGMHVPCPHCGHELAIKDYRAECCDQAFGTSFGGIAQKEPVGKHTRTSGCGWSSLRPFLADDGGRSSP